MDPASGAKGMVADPHFFLSERVNAVPQQLPELFAVLGTGLPSFSTASSGSPQLSSTTTTFKPPRPALLVNPPPHFTLAKQSPAGTQSPPAPHLQPIQQEKHKKAKDKQEHK